jgi:DNA-binding NarL/FixJ family response regulator
MAPGLERIDEAIARACAGGPLQRRRRWLLVGRFEQDGQEVLVGIRTRPPPVPRGLSRRELEVLGLLGQGSSNKVIAYELGLAWSTVRVLVHRAARKLGCAGRRELEAWVRASISPGELATDIALRPGH